MSADQLHLGDTAVTANGHSEADRALETSLPSQSGIFGRHLLDQVCRLHLRRYSQFSRPFHRDLVFCLGPLRRFLRCGSQHFKAFTPLAVIGLQRCSALEQHFSVLTPHPVRIELPFIRSRPRPLPGQVHANSAHQFGVTRAFEFTFHHADSRRIIRLESRRSWDGMVDGTRIDPGQAFGPAKVRGIHVPRPLEPFHGRERFAVKKQSCNISQHPSVLRMSSRLLQPSRFDALEIRPWIFTRWVSAENCLFGFRMVLDQPQYVLHIWKRHGLHQVISDQTGAGIEIFRVAD